MRRSWATLSRLSRMARIRPSLRSRTRLNCRASSASSPDAARVSGTRSARLPVLRMRRAVRRVSRAGAVARWARVAPPASPRASVGTITRRKAVTKGPQQRRPAVGAAADLEHGAVAQRRGGQEEVALGVLRDAQPGHRLLTAERPRRPGHRRHRAVLHLHPVAGHLRQQHAAARAGDAHEERAALAGQPAAVDEVVQRRQAAAVIDGGALLEPGGDDLLLAAFPERDQQQIQQREEHRRGEGERPRAPQAQPKGEALAQGFKPVGEHSRRRARCG